MRYRAKGGSVLVPGNPQPFAPGYELPEGALPQSRIDELLELGFLEPATPPVVAPPKKAPVVVGPWRVPPQQTEGKSLEELNLMALEIDSEIDPFETVEEAREQLSMDYHPED